MKKTVSPAIIRQAEINYRDDYFNQQNPHPGETLLETLDYCFKAGIPIPAWTQDEYRKCYKKYQAIDGIDPLVRAFRTDKGASKPNQRRMQKHLNTVCHTLLHLHINEDEAIGNDLFDEVAKRHGNLAGLSGRTIEDVYYPQVKQMMKSLKAIGIEFRIIPEFVKPPIK